MSFMASFGLSAELLRQFLEALKDAEQTGQIPVDSTFGAPSGGARRPLTKKEKVGLSRIVLQGTQRRSGHNVRFASKGMPKGFEGASISFSFAPDRVQSKIGEVWIMLPDGSWFPCDPECFETLSEFLSWMGRASLDEDDDDDEPDSPVEGAGAGGAQEEDDEVNEVPPEEDDEVNEVLPEEDDEDNEVLPEEDDEDNEVLPEEDDEDNEVLPEEEDDEDNEVLPEEEDDEVNQANQATQATQAILPPMEDE